MKAGTYLFDGRRITLTRDMERGEVVRYGDLLLDGKLPELPPDRRMPRILGRFISGGWREAKPDA